MLHGASGGIMSEIGGGDFGSGFASGAISSLIASGVKAIGNVGFYMDEDYLIYNSFANRNLGLFKAIVISSGGLSGGISSSIAGGNFWKGMQQGLITAGLNHMAKHGAYKSESKTSLLEYKEEMLKAISDRSVVLEKRIASLTSQDKSTEDEIAQLGVLASARVRIESVLGLIAKGQYKVNVGTSTRIEKGRDIHGDLVWGKSKFDLTINYDGNINSLIHETIHVHQVMFSPKFFYQYKLNNSVLSNNYSTEKDAFRVSYSLGDNIGVKSIKGITNEFLKKNGY
ncbi:hypothetical protein [Myroides sp. LoEW2-1]|uniref:hypothetical protein n=1 Tax=Myroides sp. LoEW2-1 TaxID=2683192 RepID=UPI001328E2F4|nr:hypothetical protein [Myroides sp. LoEW2-1]MVX35324.1 hypothetical protein [Myroides sp. LoEW2-1]